MLHKEFAIDPDQIQDLKDIRLLEGRFGYDKGALISAYPPGWLKQVADRICSNLSNRQPDTVTDELRELKENSVAQFGRRFRANKPWVDSASTSHQQKPFHRLVESSLGTPPTLVTSIYDLKNSDFEISHQTFRTAKALADASDLLLMNAEKVTLVDPYFCLTKPSFQNTLIELMGRCEKPKVSFHVFTEEDGKVSWEDDRQPALQEFVQKYIPKNCSLSWYSISDDGTGYMHARGLFTVKGGIKYDRGFETPRDEDAKRASADVGVMSSPEWQQKIADYNEIQLPDRFKLIHKWSSN